MFLSAMIGDLTIALGKGGAFVDSMGSCKFISEESILNVLFLFVYVVLLIRGQLFRQDFMFVLFDWFSSL